MTIKLTAAEFRARTAKKPKRKASTDDRLRIDHRLIPPDPADCIRQVIAYLEAYPAPIPQAMRSDLERRCYRELTVDPEVTLVRYEALRMRVGGHTGEGSWYTPDFAIVRSGRLEIIEVKGRRRRYDRLTDVVISGRYDWAHVSVWTG